MPYIHKHVKKISTPQLLREYRNTILQIASLEYDLKMHIYLSHPVAIKEEIADELKDFIVYSEFLQKEIEKRDL